MVVTITDEREWRRVLRNVSPTPLYVSSDREWFYGGTGILYRFVRVY